MLYLIKTVMLHRLQSVVQRSFFKPVMLLLLQSIRFFSLVIPLCSTLFIALCFPLFHQLLSTLLSPLCSPLFSLLYSTLFNLLCSLFICPFCFPFSVANVPPSYISNAFSHHSILSIILRYVLSPSCTPLPPCSVSYMIHPS
jgi:hypothetical protein